jgi:hypothetical protein
MKYALITMIENDDHNINNMNNEGQYPKPRRYESESIICFENWRKNGGWLKDIPIYAYCPSKNTISKETQDKLKDLNVTYIENYIKETDDYFCGYWNVPLAGYILEETLEEDIFIHIDLDMNLIKPLPRDLVDSVGSNDFVICGQYDDYSAGSQRNAPSEWANPFDTGFVISHRDSGFYKAFYEALKDLTENGGDDIWNEYMSDRHLHDLEEYVIDLHFNTNMYPVIRPIQRYQIGEFYTPIDEFKDSEIEGIYFWHEHLIAAEEYIKTRTREKIEYFKRAKYRP